ncbi:hypothetical protein Kpol_1063p18 [Vanderwaltozyma polyspora DSM 70294]|uniref:Regulator of rDNA transcription protein 5 n=1 Tax=Vanderwaltozyma polyspora (strain ATCC 22028 / DSM 70294 / BCRC 21397 / CBS 2163 / NBRC 10782 / NRRL Y-8283 / UCD 57-17) TaxID=436907 RepID=RRT5_VANPO|nr:uncharacterized protein Kpol_1063p18 [Vanderwaltozyma polyspora DSM 70294]A7TQR2.1 RecName: Full=Regulator of rDNA transcription protein 5 [Vanderwaltozyma polyspora DSM 70294]EDO15407.1 hypothetical protein Kpol_1063p18 [Vanderwaltozyma polyspora DSM 70294]
MFERQSNNPEPIEVSDNNPERESTADALLTTRIYISNLDYSSTEDELIEYLKDYKPLSVLVPSHTVRGFRSNHVKPLGIAYADFETPEKAREAVEALNETNFKNRNLKVKLYVPFSPENVCKPAPKPRRLSKLRRSKKPADEENNAASQDPTVEATQERGQASEDPENAANNAKQAKPTSDDTVYCGYLPKNTTDADLREHFKDYNPQEIWIFRTRAAKGPMHLQLHRHYTAALITLNSPETIAKIAEVTSTKKILGKKISVKPAYISKIQEVKKIAEQTGIAERNQTNKGAIKPNSGNGGQPAGPGVAGEPSNPQQNCDNSNNVQPGVSVVA